MFLFYQLRIKEMTCKTMLRELTVSEHKIRLCGIILLHKITKVYSNMVGIQYPNSISEMFS